AAQVRFLDGRTLLGPGQLQQTLVGQRAAVLPDEGLQGGLALAGEKQPLARLLQRVQGRILALALVLLVHRFTLTRGVVSGGDYRAPFLGRLVVGTRTSTVSRWSRSASATSSGTLRKK